MRSGTLEGDDRSHSSINLSRRVAVILSERASRTGQPRDKVAGVTAKISLPSWLATP
jgi:hypothetical protein